MSVLQAVQLSKQYYGSAALSNLNLSIDKGEMFCLLGQNGAGKTTTINLFLGFTDASSALNHTVATSNITANELQQLYLETI